MRAHYNETILGTRYEQENRSRICPNSLRGSDASDILFH